MDKKRLTRSSGGVGVAQEGRRARERAGGGPGAVLLDRPVEAGRGRGARPVRVLVVRGRRRLAARALVARRAPARPHRAPVRRSRAPAGHPVRARRSRRRRVIAVTRETCVFQSEHFKMRSRCSAVPGLLVEQRALKNASPLSK